MMVSNTQSQGFKQTVMDINHSNDRVINKKSDTFSSTFGNRDLYLTTQGN